MRTLNLNALLSMSESIIEEKMTATNVQDQEANLRAMLRNPEMEVAKQKLEERLGDLEGG